MRRLAWKLDRWERDGTMASIEVVVYIIIGLLSVYAVVIRGIVP